MRTKNFHPCVSVSLLLLVSAGMAISGCASRNQGQPDYRIVDTDNPALSVAEKFTDAPREPINSPTNIQITLDTAFIADFSEFGFRGEIAVIVNVKEFGKGSDADIDFSADGQRSGRLVYFSDDVRKYSGSKSSGVAVRNGNFLNFTSMPVYGPVAYNGRPLLIEVSVIEFDEAEVNRAKAVLQKLAALGSKAYPPASPALAVLNQIGEAFLTGEQDDSELRFHTVLYPFDAKDSATHNFLRRGDLVLVKEENNRFFGNVGSSDSPTPWSRLRLDRNTKRLMLTPGEDETPATTADQPDGEQSAQPAAATMAATTDQPQRNGSPAEEEFRDQSYFVFNITTNSKISDLNIQTEGQKLKTRYESLKQSADVVDIKKFEDLLTSFNNDANIRAEIAEVGEAIGRIRRKDYGTFGVESTFRAIIDPLHKQLSPDPKNRTWSNQQIRSVMDNLKRALADAGHADQAAKVSDDLFKKSVDEVLQALKPD